MIPNLTPISPAEVLCLEIDYVSDSQELWFSYDDLYKRWGWSEDDESMTEKILRPKDPGAADLTVNDFISLGNSLATYGFIG